MNILTQERNYLPIDIDTKLHACLRRVVSNWPIKKDFILLSCKKEFSL